MRLLFGKMHFTFDASFSHQIYIIYAPNTIHKNNEKGAAKADEKTPSTMG